MSSRPTTPADPPDWSDEPWSTLTYKGFSHTSPRRASTVGAYKVAPPRRRAARGWKLAAASIVVVAVGVAAGVWAYPQLKTRALPAPRPAPETLAPAAPALAALSPPPRESAPSSPLAASATPEPAPRASTAVRSSPHGHASSAPKGVDQLQAPRPRALAAANRASEAAEIAPAPAPRAAARPPEETTLDEQMAMIARSHASRADRPSGYTDDPAAR